MSVSSEIARIQNAKAAIASAITAKGVTVPSTTKLDGMPALISQISGGGGTQVDMYAGRAEPTATNGDLWVDTSDEGGLPAAIVAGDTPVLASTKQVDTVTNTTMTATGISIEIPKTGEYRFKFSTFRSATTGTFTAQIYKNGSAVSGATATWNSYEGTCEEDLTCDVGDTIEIRALAPAGSWGSSNRIMVSGLFACIDWDIFGGV